MPTRYDLLAVDLDGTLLNSDHRVPPANRDALHRAHAAGMKIVLCTGRAYVETEPIIHEIGLDLDAAVTVFGAVLVDVPTGRTIDCTPLTLDAARDISLWFRERKYTVLWLIDRDQSGCDGYIFDGPRRHAAVDRWLARTPCIVRRPNTLDEATSPPVRVTIIDDAATLHAVSADLEREFAGRIVHNVLTAPAYEVTLIEAFAPNVNKWYGVEKLCRRWGVDPRRTVAIGDDVNDVDLLRSAGLGVAMANAHPATRAAAHRTTRSNDEDGVAEVIAEIL
jgi:hypothetical protein